MVVVVAVIGEGKVVVVGVQHQMEDFVVVEVVVGGGGCL